MGKREGGRNLVRVAMVLAEAVLAVSGEDGQKFLPPCAQLLIRKTRLKAFNQFSTYKYWSCVAWTYVCVNPTQARNGDMAVGEPARPRT